MAERENRQLERKSLFLMADLRLQGVEGEHRVRLRNLSAGGMMAEGAVKAAPGAEVEVNIRNIGWVTGKVAWVQENRFGIALDIGIDPARVRVSPGEMAEAPAYVQPYLRKPDASRTPRRL